MERLTLDTFIQAAEDAEMSRYKVLAVLKDTSEFLNKSCLYPGFSELINLYHLLNEIISKKSTLADKKSSRLIGFDLENKKAVYEQERLTDDKVKLVFEFINWAMPKIKEVIEEGKVIFEFVDKNMKVKEIGIMPIYKKEGYFILPDNQENRKTVYRYEMTIIPAEGEKYHTFKTNFIDSFESNNLNEIKPEEIKLEMIKRYPELPNPAAFNVHLEFKFPFNETVLPIAKRKLVRELAA